MEVVITQKNQLAEENSANKFKKEEINSSNLREHVLNSIEFFLSRVRSNQDLSMQTQIIEEVESAMYEATMKFTKGNQVQAAKVLGVARGTLRTKLKQYFGTTQVGGLYHKYNVLPLKKVGPFIY